MGCSKIGHSHQGMAAGWLRSAYRASAYRQAAGELTHPGTASESGRQKVGRGQGQGLFRTGAFAEQGKSGLEGFAFASIVAFAGSVLVFILALPALAQSPAAATGGLSGKLTDLHSRPVDGATLVLRNAVTGVEARTTTTKQGGYRFNGLPPGEYTLQADSPRLGEGRIAAIFVAAGHESRVQTALSLDRQSPESMVSPSQVRSFTNPVPRLVDPPATPNAPALLRPASADKPAVITLPLQAALYGATLRDTAFGRRQDCRAPALPGSTRNDCNWSACHRSCGCSGEHIRAGNTG